MSMQDESCEKSDIIKIAEQIYETKNKIQDVTLSLENERFHARYIPQRKEIATARTITRTCYIILLALVFAICLIVFIIGSKIGATMGIFMLCAGGLGTWSAFYGVKLIKRQIENYPKLNFDEEGSKNKIALLEEEVSKLNGQLEQLEKQQNQILEQKERNERFLKEKGILVEPEKTHALKTGGLTLRDRNEFSDNIQELFELYSSEERYIQNYLDHLKFRLDEVNLEITRIDDNFEQAKKKIIIGGFAFVCLILVQGIFANFMEKLSVLIACFISLGGIFYLDKVCSEPIVLYLVEHESKLASEYAFVNNMVPIRYKREELLAIIHQNEEELKTVRDKKKALD